MKYGKQRVLLGPLRVLVPEKVWRSKAAVVGLVICACVLLPTVFAPLIATHSPSELTSDILASPSRRYLFGTDADGRDVYSRIVMGARESFIIAIAALAIGFLCGTIIGLVSGYFGGIVDTVCSRLIDIMMSFPAIMVALFVLAILTRAGKGALIIAIGLALVPRFARVIRGATLPIREAEYIVAARALAGSHIHILLHHVLPNLVSPMTVLCTIYLPFVILTEASLSFLGLGPPPDVPTWGRIIADGRAYLRLAPWIAVFPGFAIMATVIGFNLVGDGLRDIIDPKTTAKGTTAV